MTSAPAIFVIAPGIHTILSPKPRVFLLLNMPSNLWFSCNETKAFIIPTPPVSRPGFIARVELVFLPRSFAVALRPHQIQASTTNATTRCRLTTVPPWNKRSADTLALSVTHDDTPVVQADTCWCGLDESFMAQLWHNRRSTYDCPT